MWIVYAILGVFYAVMAGIRLHEESWFAAVMYLICELIWFFAASYSFSNRKG